MNAVNGKLATSHLSKFISTDFHSPPAFKLPAVGFAVDGADVERVAVAVHRADDVFREGAAVGAEPVDDHAEVLHEPFKKSLQRILLMEPDVCVPVPVLYAEQQAAETEYAGEIPAGPLVGVLRVMFPRGGELVVEVQVQHAALFEQAQTEQHRQEQTVQSFRRVESV
jgi:hypothetical protein